MRCISSWAQCLLSGPRPPRRRAFISSSQPRYSSTLLLLGDRDGATSGARAHGCCHGPPRSSTASNSAAVFEGERRCASVVPDRSVARARERAPSAPLRAELEELASCSPSSSPPPRSRRARRCAAPSSRRAVRRPRSLRRFRHAALRHDADAELVDADGARVHERGRRAGLGAPVGAVVIAFFTTLLPMCARRYARPRGVRPPHSTLTRRLPLQRARPGEEAFQGMQKAEEGRSEPKAAASRGAAAAARVAVAHMLFEV